MPPDLSERRLEPALVRDRFASVLRFATEHVSRLDSYAAHWTDKTEDIVRLEDKVLAETAILCLLASRVAAPGSAEHRLVGELTKLLDAAIDTDRLTAVLLRCPHAAPALGLPHIVLHSLGRGDEGIQEILTRIFAADLACTMERLPYRAMEVRWVESLLASTPRTPAVDVADLVPLNVLSKPVHPISMTRATGYALTHGIMYATDFGAVPLDGALDVDLLRARLDAALAWVLVNEDLDLLVEFIIAATLLRRPWSPYVWSAWDLCNAVWDSLGLLPSPSFDAKQFATLEGAAASAYAFRHVYHTTYVVGVLGSVLLAMDGALAAPWTRPRLDTATTADACADAVKRARAFAASEPGDTDPAPDGPPPHPDPLGLVTALVASILPDHVYWRDALSRSDGDRGVLAQVLGDAAIIHAARVYDLPKMLTALNAVIALPGAPSLTVLEGVSFLVRQQFPDGCIGAQFATAAARASTTALDATRTIADYLQAYATRLRAG